MKIFTTANVPDELGQAWLQHLRDFDVAHPGCHFEVGIDAPEHSLQEMVEMMQLNPALTFIKIFDRAQSASLSDRPQTTQITDSMVEAAAKAIIAAAYSEDEMPPWEDYEPHARAALEAAQRSQEAKER